MSRPVKDWFAKTFDDWVDEGYPEEIIPDILSGDLPMDGASKAARAAEQGYGPVWYRGHAEGNAPRSNQDIWMSDTEDVADTYAMGGEYYDEATDSYKIRDGHTVPLRTNANNLLVKDAEGMNYEDVVLERSDVPDMEWMDYQRSTDKTDGIAAAVKDEGTRQGVLFKNIIDDFYGSEDDASNVLNVLGTRPDVKIRHADAAFHPTYNGPNIKGNADPRLLGGMAVGLTTAGLVAPEIAQRFPMPEGGNRAGWLEYVTNLGDETQKSLRHTTGGVSDYFFPESVNDYLKTVNAEDEEPTWSDRLWAGLDAFRVPGK